MHKLQLRRLELLRTFIVHYVLSVARLPFRHSCVFTLFSRKKMLCTGEGSCGGALLDIRECREWMLLARAGITRIVCARLDILAKIHSWLSEFWLAHGYLLKEIVFIVVPAAFILGILECRFILGARLNCCQNSFQNQISGWRFWRARILEAVLSRGFCNDSFVTFMQLGYFHSLNYNYIVM